MAQLPNIGGGPRPRGRYLAASHRYEGSAEALSKNVGALRTVHECHDITSHPSPRTSAPVVPDIDSLRPLVDAPTNDLLPPKLARGNQSCSPASLGLAPDACAAIGWVQGGYTNADESFCNVCRTIAGRPLCVASTTGRAAHVAITAGELERGLASACVSTVPVPGYSMQRPSRPTR